MTDSTASPGQASRRATLGLLAAILLLLIWYLLADRLTPYSSQARVQAFVVPVAAEVSGQIKRVYVHDNQDVDAGSPLFEIDPEPYDIALAKANSDYQTVLRGLKANPEGTQAAEAPRKTKHIRTDPHFTRRFAEHGEDTRGLEQREKPRRDQPGEKAADEPVGFPRPAFDAFVGDIETAGGQAAEPVEEDTEDGIHDGWVVRMTAGRGRRLSKR